jgi:hypothetical protein
MSSKVVKIFGYLWGIVRRYFIIDWFDEESVYNKSVRKYEAIMKDESAKEGDKSNCEKMREYVPNHIPPLDCCIEPVDFVEYKDTLSDEEFNMGGLPASSDAYVKVWEDGKPHLSRFVLKYSDFDEDKEKTFDINGCDSCTLNVCDSCTLSGSENTLSEGKDIEFQVNDCLYNYDEEVRVKNGVYGIATRYYGRKGVIKSILMVGNKYRIGLKIHDRINLLYVWEDSVDNIEDPINRPYSKIGVVSKSKKNPKEGIKVE